MKKVILAVFLIFLPTWAHADQPSDDPNTVAALQFVNSFWLNWSSAAQVAIPYIDTSVGDRISFFGKSISHREYMRIEESFVRRWPDRNYLMQDGSQAKCDQKTATCVISGTILWSVHNHDTAAQSYGSSKFSFTLREQTIDGQKLFTIIAEVRIRHISNTEGRFSTSGFSLPKNSNSSSWMSPEWHGWKYATGKRHSRHR